MTEPRQITGPMNTSWHRCNAWCEGGVHRDVMYGRPGANPLPPGFEWEHNGVRLRITAVEEVRESSQLHPTGHPEYTERRLYTFEEIAPVRWIPQTTNEGDVS